MKTKMYIQSFAAALFFLSFCVYQVHAQTSVHIRVINLPVEFEGVELALAGTLNNWNNDLSKSVVQNNTLNYTFDNVVLVPLDNGWQNKPEGANTAFSFFVPDTWTQRIVGSYGSNDNNFRITLISDTSNTVVIDAQYSLTSPPGLIIDIGQPCIIVNGEIQLPPSKITKLTISVIHLPNDFEGRKIALFGSVLQDKNIPVEAAAINNSLSYTFEDVVLFDLGPEWTGSPLDANTSFAFIDPQTLEQEIIGDYNNNDNYFRVRLAGNMNNTVVIDANDQTGTSPLTINQFKGISVNGNIHLPNSTIDPTRYTWPGGKWKALIMSYDDGPAADEQMVNLFKTNGIVGTFNLTSSFLDKADFLASSQVQSLFDGHEVANHSEHHPYLAQGDVSSIRSQIKNCGDALNNLVGYNINGMAYPFGGAGTGAYDYRVIDIAQNLGIRYARTTNDTRSLEIPGNIPDGLMQWDPTINDWDGETFVQLLIDWDKERMALLYMWGHSHFLDNNGWNRLTTICQKSGNRSDIWYAKNIEVAVYLRAINNLIYTDSSVYNPSSDISVWLKTENGLEEIGPGQKIITGVEDKDQGILPDSYELCQNYPNPFNPTTTISFQLPKMSDVSLRIYNISGQLIRTLVSNKIPSGRHNIRWDGTSNVDRMVSSGVYIYKLESGRFTSTRKMVLIK